MSNKIKQSDRIVANILGPSVVSFFEITARRTQAGGSTFSLWYNDHGRVPLVVDEPLREVRAALENIRAANSLVGFGRYLVEGLTSERRFDPRLLNGHGWTWCAECHGLVSGRVVVNDYYILKAAPSEAPYGPIVEACTCPDRKLEITEVLPRYGIIVGSIYPFSGVSKVVRWQDDHWTTGHDRAPEGSAVQEIGRFRSWSEANAVAECGSYHYRSRGGLYADWTLGPILIPSHAAESGDVELGELDSRADAWKTARETARYRTATLEEAVETARHIAEYGSSGLPHGLLTRLAELLGGRAAQYDLSLVRGEVWDTQYSNWVFNLGDGQLLLAEEHYNPRAGTCCSKVTEVDRDQAFRLLERHSWPVSMDGEAIQAFLAQE
jgi:hypothetical protein